ncbi:hypothetical protein [Thiomicrospira pelophila]|nr:hypothetical protein [Thiomicrospira pelophila]
MAKARGLKVVMGEVLAENHSMLELAKHHGFKAQVMQDDPGVVEVSLTL